MLRLTFPGDYNDVFLYMDYAFLVNSDFQIEVVSLKHWVQYLIEFGIPEAACLALLSEVPIRAPEDYELPSIPKKVIVGYIPLSEPSLLDLQIYNRSLYYSTSQRLYRQQLCIEQDYEGCDVSTPFIDTAALQIRPKWGVVAAACGVDGLLTRQAATYGNQLLPKLKSNKLPTRHASRVGWLNYSLLSLRDDGFLLVKNEVSDEARISVDGNNERVLKQIGTEILDSADSSTTSFKFHYQNGFASNSYLYGWGKGATFYAHRFDNGRFSPTPRRFNLPATRILEGYSFSRGLVFDTDAGTIHAIPTQNGEIRIISQDENVMSRVFPNSKHYPGHVWSIKESRVDVCIIPK